MENWRGKHDEDVEVGAVGAALVLAAIAASSTVVLAHDDEDNDRELAAQLVQRGEILPPEQILQSESIPPERRGYDTEN